MDCLSPTLGKIKAITLTYHLMMKFLTLIVIGKVKGDQKFVRLCFITAMKTSILEPRAK